MHIALVTRSLLYGGTERQLALLGRGLRERGHRVSVLQLYEDADFGDELDTEGIERAHLGVRSRGDLLRLAARAATWARACRPDIVHGFHVESNLLALLLGRARRARVVWGIRVDDPTALASDRVARAAARLHERLLRVPDLIVANSGAGLDWAVARGAHPRRVRLIRNAVDTAVFRYDEDGRRRLRAEWHVAEEEVLIGTVARLEERKAPELFVRAAALFASREPSARFVWVGHGEPSLVARLRALARRLGVDGRIVWAGARRDVAAVHSALDLETLLSARGEGMSNALAEALACARLVVFTDTGDSVQVAGEHGVVTPREPHAVAGAWAEALSRSTGAARSGARVWVEREFSSVRMLDHYEAALVGVL